MFSTWRIHSPNELAGFLGFGVQVAPAVACVPVVRPAANCGLLSVLSSCRRLQAQGVLVSAKSDDEVEISVSGRPLGCWVRECGGYGWVPTGQHHSNGRVGTAEAAAIITLSLLPAALAASLDA